MTPVGCPVLSCGALVLPGCGWLIFRGGVSRCPVGCGVPGLGCPVGCVLMPVPFGAGFISVIYITVFCIYTSLPGGTVGTCGYLPVRTSVRIGNGRVQVGARTVRVYGTADAFVVVGHVLCGRELGGYALILPRAGARGYDPRQAPGPKGWGIWVWVLVLGRRAGRRRKKWGAQL